MLHNHSSLSATSSSSSLLLFLFFITDNIITIAAIAASAIIPYKSGFCVSPVFGDVDFTVCFDGSDVLEGVTIWPSFV